MQKIRMEEMLLDLTYENNCDGNVLILFIILISFLFFFNFFFFGACERSWIVQICVIMQIWREHYMYKKHEGTNVTHVMSLVMMQWKCVLNTKQKWRLTI
jgi:hypothetical protein